MSQSKLPEPAGPARGWLAPVAALGLGGMLLLQWTMLGEQSRTRASVDRLARALEASARVESTAAPASASAANEDVFRQAESLVDGALAAHVWGDKQVAELRRLRGRLTQEQLVSLLARLIPAINAQTIRVETHGPPF